MTDKRSSRQSAGRLSHSLRRGKGDPRDHRREQIRLTERDIDPDDFEIVDGRLSLKGASSPPSSASSESLGSSLRLDSKGRIELRPASRVADADTATPTAAENAATINVLLTAMRNAGMLEQ